MGFKVDLQELIKRGEFFDKELRKENSGTFVMATEKYDEFCIAVALCERLEELIRINSQILKEAVWGNSTVEDRS